MLERLSQHITKGAVYGYLVRHRRLAWSALALLALALAGVGYFAFRARQPVVLSDAERVEAALLAGQLELRVAEAVTQLEVVRGQLALPIPPRLVLSSLTNASRRALEAAYEATPVWAQLEPLLDSLAVQVANADPQAAATIDQVIGLLRAEPAV